MERNNNISINVFGEEDDNVYPLRLSDNPQTAINLMLLNDGQNTHWVWIKNFSRLCSDKTKRTKHARYFCMRCLSGHITQENLDKHLLFCQDHDICRADLPKPGTQLKFKNFHKQLKCPYVSKLDGVILKITRKAICIALLVCA